jgi:hypothetical protein
VRLSSIELEKAPSRRLGMTRKCTVDNKTPVRAGGEFGCCCRAEATARDVPRAQDASYKETVVFHCSSTHSPLSCSRLALEAGSSGSFEAA